MNRIIHISVTAFATLTLLGGSVSVYACGDDSTCHGTPASEQTTRNAWGCCEHETSPDSLSGQCCSEPDSPSPVVTVGGFSGVDMAVAENVPMIAARAATPAVVMVAARSHWALPAVPSLVLRI